MTARAERASQAEAANVGAAARFISFYGELRADRAARRRWPRSAWPGLEGPHCAPGLSNTPSGLRRPGGSYFGFGAPTKTVLRWATLALTIPRGVTEVWASAATDEGRALQSPTPGPNSARRQDGKGKKAGRYCS